MKPQTPALMVAAPNSGAGKTTITLGILAACRQRNMDVQSFKTGPDYIDAGLHSLVTGRPCRNLDTWMLSSDELQRLFYRAAEKAELSLVEGVMGLFDGVAEGKGRVVPGSSAHLALSLGLPVVLVMDVKSSAQTIAAMVFGLINYEPTLKIAGVILNRVGSERHAKMISSSIENECGIPVLGAIGKDVFAAMPSRHLGLVSAPEKGPEFMEYVNELGRLINREIDMNALIERAAACGQYAEKALAISGQPRMRVNSESKIVKIALARDEAFHFYYQDGLDDLAEAGVQWVPFSPLREGIPANVDGVFLGGGYPELYLEQLSANQGFFDDLRHLAKLNLPLYAECGGYMSLCHSITDLDGREYPLASIVPAHCQMEKRRVGLGYIEAQLQRDCLLGQAGLKLRGHEFHYSSIVPENDGVFPFAFKLTKTGATEKSFNDGFAKGNIIASYLHYHFSASLEVRRWFVSRFK